MALNQRIILVALVFILIQTDNVLYSESGAISTSVLVYELLNSLRHSPPSRNKS